VRRCPARLHSAPVGPTSRPGHHGGRETPRRSSRENLTRRPVEALCVESSGWDLIPSEPQGLSALELAWLRRLRKLEKLPTRRWSIAARRLFRRPAHRTPRWRRCWHAFCRTPSSTHHADAILALTNQPDGAELVHQALGTGWCRALRHARFQLPSCRGDVRRKARCDGIVLLKHGLFPRDDARAATNATSSTSTGPRLSAGGSAAAWPLLRPANLAQPGARMSQIAPVLRAFSRRPVATGSADRRVILEHRATPEVLAWWRAAVRFARARGPLTPIRHPAKAHTSSSTAGLGDTEALRRRLRRRSRVTGGYDRYFDDQVRAKGVKRTKLDPDTRLLMPAWASSAPASPQRTRHRG